MEDITIQQKDFTNKEGIEKYLKDMGVAKPLTPEEEVSLAPPIRQGDQKALDKLIKANLRFVVKIAKEYQHQGLSLPDLIQEGNLGLVKAAPRWDETRGFKFFSYAVWWIRQSILQALAETSRLVRLPSNKIGDHNKIDKAFMAFEQKHEREPSAEELAELLEMKPENISGSFNIGARHLSLDAPLNKDEEGAGTFLDTKEDINIEKTDNALTHEESLKIEIDRALETLSPRDKEIICLLLGIGTSYPMSPTDISIKFGLTVARIGQIKNEIFGKMRKNDRLKKLLKTYPYNNEDNKLSKD